MANTLDSDEVTPSIVSMLESLARGESHDLSAYLTTIESNGSVDNTRSICHCHFISLDGNSRPRTKDFINKICSYVLSYAIPRSIIRDAFDKFALTKSPTAVTALHNEAKELFTSLEKTGEGGELLLFVLAETLLNLPQLICKMDLKTSTQVHYHGADGIHVGVDENTGKLALYWGESKIYGNASSAIRDCFQSLAPLLHGSGGTGSPEKRDLQLLSRYLDLDNSNIETALKSYLNPDSPNFNSVEFRGLALVGFDSEAYPGAPNAKTSEQVASEISNELKKIKERISDRATMENIHSFVLHVFCLPLPNADEFRQLFRREMGLTSGN